MRIASVHLYPIKGCHRVDVDRARVEPWGLAGDRRWLLVDPDTGRGLTQRDLPRLTQLRPRLVEGGGLVVSTPGMPDLAVAEPIGGDQLDVQVWSFTGPATRVGPAADHWFSAALDDKVSLVWQHDSRGRRVDQRYGQPDDVVSFADGYPLLATNEASLVALNDWLVEDASPEGPLPMTRFRPNLVVSGATAWAEDDWLGRTLRIGDTAYRAVKPCDRCVVTTTDQETGIKGHEPLRTLGRRRNVNQLLLFGLNLIPDIGPNGGIVAVGDEVRLD